MQKIILLLTLLIAVILYNTCSESTAPGDNNGPDTTSHNFTWEIDTIGTRSSSLSDVAIIDKNNIWAVGQIYTEEQTPYNAVHWNGQKWELIRIPVKLFGTNNFYTFPLTAIIAFNENDIVVTEGGQLIFYDGKEWNGWHFLFHQLDDSTFGSIKKFWGTSKTDFYGVGNNGFVIHNNGNTWQSIDSGTDIDIQDIWGGKNQETGENEILAIASLRNYGRGLALLKIDGERVIHLDTTGLHVNQSSIWFSPNNKYYISGNGVFKKEKIIDSSEWFKLTGHPDIYKYSIRGNAYNDIFIVGSFGLVSHYNGSSWKHYSNIEWPSFYGAWYKCSVSPDIVAAVGTLAGLNGLILRGYRN